MSRPIGLAVRRIGQTFSFANPVGVLAGLASSGTPWRRPELVFRTRGGLVVACPNHAGARVPVYEVFAEDSYRIEELVSGLGPDPVVIDIGAQVGCFALRVAERLPGARVHAYEASPSTTTWLERNIRTNSVGDRVSTHGVALSGRAGTVAMADNGRGSALNSARGDQVATVAVPSVTFADALAAAGGSADVVKIDTEGAEYDIVLATTARDWQTVRRLVIEYHPVQGRSWADLSGHLAPAGFVETRHEHTAPGQGVVWLERHG